MNVFKYPYLADSSFLREFDRIRNKEQFVKITVLTFDEKPIQDIQGRVTGGNINLDGKSSVRRTCNLTMVAAEKENDLTNIDNLISINKKVKIEIGITNTTDKYLDYPIIWFPQGVYVIINPSISYGAQGVSISLQLKDKMCLLNGECGGVLPATVIFHEYEILAPDGTYQISKPTIPQIIKEVVHHFGGEQLGKIIISDIDNRVRQVMRWMGDEQLTYVLQKDENGQIISNSWVLDFEKNQPKPEEGEEFYSVESGEEVGYIYTDFTFPGELIGEPGNTVCTILDKIRDTLGNYEYFYDIDGNFIFQEKKNYMNTAQSNDILDEESGAKVSYDIDIAKSKTVYDFDDGVLITSYSNTPQFNQIKNDFIVWGERTVGEIVIPIRYHLALDKKPEIGNEYTVFLYNENDIKKARQPVVYETIEDLPKVGIVGEKYLVLNDIHGYAITKNLDDLLAYFPIIEVAAMYDEYKDIKTDNSEIGKIYYAAKNETGEDEPAFYIKKDNEIVRYEEQIIFIFKCKGVYYERIKNKDNKISYEEKTIDKGEHANSYWTLPEIDEDNEDQTSTLYVTIQSAYEWNGKEYEIVLDRNGGWQTITTTDWRTELYLSGVEADPRGIDSNYYYAELANEWPKSYDIEEGHFLVDNVTDLDYYLDFIDNNALSEELGVSNIGRRTKVINDDKINCIFEPEIPGFYLVPAGTTETPELRAECEANGDKYCQVESTIYENLIGGGIFNSAYEMVRSLLHQHLNYNNTITINTIPIFHLEPNVRVFIRDDNSGIYGDYMINSFSIPLDINGTTTFSCSKAIERI